MADLIDPPPSLEPTGSEVLFSQLLNGPCDLDKLEYVARGAQACGFSGGFLDPSALLSELHVYAPDALATPRLALPSPALPLLRTWIHLRHWLYLHAYWHPTNRTGAAMLTRAVQDALENETLTIAQLQQTDDPGLLALLMAPGMPESTRTLTSLLAMDHLYQPMVEISHQATALFECLLKLAQDARRRKWVE